MAGIEAQIEAVLAEIREVKGDIQRMANILDDPDSTLSEQKESSINIRLGGLESRLAALTNLQTELIRQRATPSITTAATDRLQVKLLAKQSKAMAAMLGLLEEIGDKDCYDQISSSSKPRELTKAEYESTYCVPVSKLQCMVTGISHESIIRSFPSPGTPDNPVTLAHILARNAEAKEMLSLGFKKADVENIRNSLLICKGIEEAFDNKFVSFVPSEEPFSSNRYKLHIWVDAVRDEPIFEGSNWTIGSFDGAPLNLTVGTMSHNPFKRAMSYQAFRAFKKWGKGFGLTKLPEDSDTSTYERAYKSIRAQYAMQLARDIADEEDEDEIAEEEQEAL